MLSQCLGELYPERGAAATTWWVYFRLKYPKDQSAEITKRMRTLVEGRMTLKEFTPVAEDAIKMASVLNPREQHDRFLAIADSSLDAGADTLLKTCLEKAEKAACPPPPPKDKVVIEVDEDWPSPITASMRFGDYYANKKDWTHASEHYAKAWELDRENPYPNILLGPAFNPLPVYLRGLALIKAGQEKEGKRLIELAHDLPLAHARVRYEFAHDLLKRGHADAARLELELVARIYGYQESWLSERAFLRLAEYASTDKNYAKAAGYFERSLICHQGNQSGYSPCIGYLLIPAAVHSNRAMAFLTADKLADAQREIQTCLDILPGDINLPILLVPEMEKKGHKKEAADLFAKVWGVHEELCNDYPKSAWAHNNIAWLAVRCRRNLDDAYKHAKLAVDLAPETTGYLDTLAEVYFQKGDKDKALELAKRCIQMDPKSAYYQRQLKRIEAGDPSVDVPEQGN
jgi:tetratricopeptide (TPR) repeat protein